MARIFKLLIFVSCAFSVPQICAQQKSAPTFQQAVGDYFAKKYDDAIAKFSAITVAKPEHGFAWLYLGNSYQAKEDFPNALAAFEKSSEIEATKGRAMYSIGTLHASQGNHDEAFKWLLLARDSARVDVTSIGLTKNIEAFKSDSRYQTLFPTPDQYAEPFVESVQVIHDWHGEAEGDQFGWIARNIGDVDGDGADDLTTSAPSNTEGGEAAGKVYVYSGRSGVLLWSATGEAKAQLGLGIEAAGDVDADGILDVLAGAPGVDKCLVYSGSDGKLLLTLEGEHPGDFFGRKVSDIGDWNGDGHDDLLIGAPRSSSRGKNTGSSYVFSGKDGERLFTWLGEKAGARHGSSAGGMRVDSTGFLVVGAPGAGPRGTGRTYVYNALQAEPFFVIESDSTGSSLGGMFVSVVGDVDSDGVQDIYASDWSNSALGRSTGRVYVHSGKDGSRLFALTGEAAGDGFGIGVADAGDVNSDGHNDLIIGAWQHAGSAPSGGKCYLYSGKDATLLQTYTGKVAGETFGFDATGMGDVNGDGAIDLLLTSGWSAINGSRSGRMLIVSSRVLSGHTTTK